MRWIFPVFFALLAAGAGWLFLTRYWLFRGCIAAALSSCVTSDGDNLTAGGMFWGAFAILFAMVALFAARR